MQVELPNETAAIIWRDHFDKEEEEQVGSEPQESAKADENSGIVDVMTKPMLPKPSDEWQGSTNCVRKMP